MVSSTSSGGYGSDDGIIGIKVMNIDILSHTMMIKKFFTDIIISLKNSKDDEENNSGGH